MALLYLTRPRSSLLVSELMLVGALPGRWLRLRREPRQTTTAFSGETDHGVLIIIQSKMPVYTVIATFL